MSDSSAVICVQGLCKSFDKVQAVKDLSFSVQSGQAVGFIGANGAGKTTTMRIMATLDQPDEGVVEICGLDVVQYPNEVRQLIGWMPDSYGAYELQTCWEYLDFFARAYGFKGAERKNRVDEVMEFTGLVPLAERDANKLSKGESQRLCLGRTLLPDPKVLILDEPAAGLDPKARVEFKHLIRLLVEQGKTMFISSHILSELEEMCDTMLFIDRGALLHHGSTESLKTRDGAAVLVLVEVDGSPDALRNWVETFPGIAIHEATKHGYRIRLDDATTSGLVEILRAMVHDGIRVHGFHRDRMRLEDAFVDIISQRKT
jgi:ABC-2 type transport system ATP-binding protein